MYEFIIIAVYLIEGGAQQYNGPTVFADNASEAVSIGWDCWESSGAHIESNEPDKLIARMVRG